jgi:hypothetical protein
MNLFFLDNDLDKCAEYHVDRHVNKLQLEAAQILCTNVIIDHLFGYVPRNLTKDENAKLSVYRRENKDLAMEDRFVPYLPCHQNHPSTVWCRTSLENFYWTHCYANALSSEAHYRYGSVHKSIEVINNLPEPVHMKDIGFTTFALAMKIMPDKYKNENDPILSYRNFYMYDKNDFAEWKYRDKPDWWNNAVVAQMEAEKNDL